MWIALRFKPNHLKSALVLRQQSWWEGARLSIPVLLNITLDATLEFLMSVWGPDHAIITGLLWGIDHFLKMHII